MCELTIEHDAALFVIWSMCVSLNEIMVLRTFGCGLEERLIVCHNLLVSFLKLHLSRRFFHLFRTCSFTNPLTFCDNSSIRGFDGSVELIASL